MDFEYQINNNNTVTITDYIGNDNNVTIPSEIEGKKVVEIGDSVFSDCTNLTSIAIPDSVTEIGDYAFHDCTSLKSVTIPDSVTEIGHGAFSGCTNLTSINIPDNVNFIGDYTFEYCTSLTSVNIPDSVTEIGHGAFAGCSSLTSINIPDSVYYIGDYAFYGCTSLIVEEVYKGWSEVIERLLKEVELVKHHKTDLFYELKNIEEMLETPDVKPFRIGFRENGVDSEKEVQYFRNVKDRYFSIWKVSIKKDGQYPYPVLRKVL